MRGFLFEKIRLFRYEKIKIRYKQNERDKVMSKLFIGFAEESIVPEKKIYEMSVSEKQTVEILKVLYRGADILILDEPTAGLDPIGRAEILGNIEAYRKAKNATIMMVSHSMNDVARLADRLLVMCDAQLAMDGTPDEIFRHAQQLLDMGLDIPELTRVFMRLKGMGLDVPAVYTMEQAVCAIRKLKEGI